MKLIFGGKQLQFEDFGLQQQGLLTDIPMETGYDSTSNYKSANTTKQNVRWNQWVERLLGLTL